VFNVYFLYLELRKLRIYGMRYFKKFWSLVNTAVTILTTTVVVFDLLDFNRRERVPLLS